MIEIINMEDANEYRQRTDTPPEDTDVLVYINGSGTYITYRRVPFIAQWSSDSGWDIDTARPLDEFEVLAWRNIPEYKEE